MNDESVAHGANFLEHYGVKGMKWGVRRTRAQLESAREARATRRVKAIEKQGRTGYKEKGNKLTENQLNDRIKRMETEKKYNDLNSRTVGDGEKLAREIVQSIGSKTVKAVGTAATIYVAKTVATEKFGADGAKLAELIKNPKQ